MAKKPKAPPSLGDPGDDQPTSRLRPAEVEQLRQEQAVQDLLRSEKINGSTLELKRRIMGEADFSHLKEIDGEGFTVEKIRKLFGGGEYRGTFRAPNGTILQPCKFKIDEFSNPPLGPDGLPRDQQNRNSSAMDMPKLIESLTAALKQAPVAPPPAPDNSLLIEVLRQNGEMAKAAMNKPAGPDPTVTMLLEQMRNLTAEIKELKSGGGAKPQSLAAAIADQMKVQEYMLSLNGGGGDGDDDKPVAEKSMMEKAIEMFGPLLANMMAQQQANNAAANSPQVDPLVAAKRVGPIPVTSAAPVGGPTPAAQKASMDLQFKLFLPMFRNLALAQAAKNKPPVPWVETKLDELRVTAPGSIKSIYGLANSDDWLTQLFPDAEKNQAVIANKDWLQEMRLAVLTFRLRDDAIEAYTTAPRPTAQEYAKNFMDRTNDGFDDQLFALTAPEASAWPGLFAESGIDVVWLENLRAELEQFLTDDDEGDQGAPVVDIPPSGPAPTAAAAVAVAPEVKAEEPKAGPPAARKSRGK